MSNAFSVEFRPIQDVELVVRFNGKEAPEQLRVTFSGSPPYFELIESSGAFFGSGAGAHHVGGFVEDLEAVPSDGGAGLTPLAEVYAPNGFHFATFFEPEGLYGVGLELATAHARPSWEAYVTGKSDSIIG
jgi:hypothetical protein